MTGLNLESFLHLLRADLGAWALLGLVACVLMVMVWTSWGSRRALRKCLVLSITAHLGLALYGSTFLFLLLALQPRGAEEQAPRARIRQIRIAPWSDEEADAKARAAEPRSEGNRSGTRLMPWDRPRETLALAESRVDPPRPAVPAPEALAPLQVPPSPALPAATAAPESKLPAPAAPESRPEPVVAADWSRPPEQAAPADPADVAAPVVVFQTPADPAPASRTNRGERLRPARDPAPAPQPENGRPLLPPGPLIAPDFAPPPAVAADRMGTAAISSRTEERPPPRTEPPAIEPVDPRAASDAVKPIAAPPPPEPALPEAEVRRRSRPETASDAPPELGVLRRASEPAAPIALTRVVPSSTPRLPEVQGTSGGRRWSEVPAVYRSRLDPNRSELAQRAGASPASEQAVERALDWLARHQDNDGRWDGSTARYDDGSAVKGDDDYTIHCPPGEPCFGECIYWEADTALTGLALLSFLGSGYTQVDGKYARTVEKGVGFLLLQQKPDGDLRGRSRAVGMYCHAMATLALCEAYALTGDERLRNPVARAVTFLIGARARDGMAWRYDRGFSTGDTSILGWVVMALKSAKVVGIPGPDAVREGTLAWLKKVAGGPALGLGKYQPNDPITPTMTAEAWVCRQFLGVGGPSPASTEAADYLLTHGPNRDPYNLYYWYYGTLAMYQHGGDAWTRWNATIRDQLVQRQRNSGHIAGSWDPDDSLYGAKGGRIYCTALATLTLEVYYRFLRLYDDPKLPALPATLPRRSDDPTAALRPTTGSTP
jgi:hypothetical protein